jgi:flavin-binding protein dodecin
LNNINTSRDDCIAEIPQQEENIMSDHVYKLIEVAGSSTVGTDDAIRNAVAKAAETVKNMDWFEVTETRGHIENGQVAHFQVVVRIGFRLE